MRGHDLVKVVGFVFCISDGLAQLFDFVLVGDVFVCSQAVDEADAVDSFSEGSFCVEGRLDIWEQIFLRVGSSRSACVGSGALEPGMVERLLGGETLARINGESWSIKCFA